MVLTHLESCSNVLLMLLIKPNFHKNINLVLHVLLISEAEYDNRGMSWDFMYNYVDPKKEVNLLLNP